MSLFDLNGVKQSMKHGAPMVALLAAMALASANASGEPAQKLWTLEGLHQPESVVADPASNHLYISNINGKPLELNGKGYISRVSREGKMQEQFWVTGLDAPKGMTIVGQRLYVADMQQVHIIDLQTGAVIGQLQAPDATMLNDIGAAPDGTLYVSDLLGGGLYRISDGRMARWFSSDQLPHPNGLLWHKGKLLVAGWGYPLNPDFTTGTPGSLYQMDIRTQAITALPAGYQLGNLDGVVAVKDTLYVSDWISGDLFALHGQQRVKSLSLPAGLADIGGAGDTLYAPMMLNNQVVAWKVGGSDQ